MSSTNSSSPTAASAICINEASVVLTFLEPNGRHDGSQHDGVDNSQHTLRLSLKSTHDPPITTFRFFANVYSSKGENNQEKRRLYFDVPPHHILSTHPEWHVDTTASLGKDDRRLFAGSVTRLRFLLRQPGHLVQPSHEMALKPGSQRILDSLKLLSTAKHFDVYLPHTAVSKEHLDQIVESIASPLSRSNSEQQSKERSRWLGALYGGAGGRVFAVDNDQTASESGDTTVADTPPPYSTALDDSRAAAGSSSDKTPIQSKGKTPGKRARSSSGSDREDGRTRSLRFSKGDPSEAIIFLQQIVAELAALRERVDEVESTNEELRSRIQELEDRVEELEDGKGELEERVDVIEEKFDVNEIDVTDTVKEEMKEIFQQLAETI